MTDEDWVVIRSIEGTIKASTDPSFPSRLVRFLSALYALLRKEHQPGFTDAWTKYNTNIGPWVTAHTSYMMIALASLHYAYNHGVSAATLNMLAATHLS